jgi:hypothetical protein
MTRVLKELDHEHYELVAEDAADARRIAYDLASHPDWYMYVTVDEASVEFAMALNGIEHLQHIAPYTYQSPTYRWYAQPAAKPFGGMYRDSADGNYTYIPLERWEAVIMTEEWAAKFRKFGQLIGGCRTRRELRRIFQASRAHYRCRQLVGQKR